MMLQNINQDRCLSVEKLKVFDELSEIIYKDSVKKLNKNFQFGP